jgi:hypothetical protein
VRGCRQVAIDHGLQALVGDPRFTPTDEPECEAQALAAAKEYADHPGTFGFSVCDEPVRSDFERVGRVIRALRNEFPEKVAYVNGLGWGCRGADSFLEYVEEYARIEGDPVIVSFLKGNDKRYMMIVNRNPGKRGRVVVEMQKGWKGLEGAPVSKIATCRRRGAGGRNADAPGPIDEN